MQPSHDAQSGVGRAQSGSEIAFDVLGPVSAQAGTAPIALRGDKRRSLLAALLLRSDRGVPVATADLVRILWGAATSADQRRGALQVQVARLRAALGADGGGRLVTGSAGGYRIELGADQLDLLRMRRTTAEAAAAENAGDPRRAFRLLRRALRLWKGPIAAGARTPVLEDEDVRPLEDELLTAAEHWGSLGLRLGRADSCLEDLGRIAGRHPERERLVEIQMRALHRAGRRGDALELFGRTRRALAQRLGLDPGRSLQRTFEGLLRGTLEPAGAQARPGAVSGGRSAPAQLPAPPAALVGRSTHLAAVDERLPDPPRGAGVLLGGWPGGGSSAVALHWAHSAAHRFPDGRLYADLSSAGDPLEVAGRFLRALGFGGALPEGLDERSALLRTVTAPLRVLVVLDNAQHSGQVSPLLPGGGGCAVLVAAGTWLGDLIARNGLTAVGVGPLESAEGAELLRGRVGADRVDAEPRAAERLVQLAGGLPLPLCTAAAWLSTHPGADLAGLAERVGRRKRSDEEAPATLMAAALGGDPRFLIAPPAALDGSGPRGIPGAPGAPGRGTP